MSLDGRITDVERELRLRPQDVPLLLELARLYEVSGREVEAGWAYLCSEVFGHLTFQCRERMPVIMLVVDHPEVSVLAAFLRYLKSEAQRHARRGASRMAGAALAIKLRLADWLESCRSHDAFRADALVKFLAEMYAEQLDESHVSHGSQWSDRYSAVSVGKVRQTPIEEILSRMEPADLLDRVRAWIGLPTARPEISWLDELLFDESDFPVNLYALNHAD